MNEQIENVILKQENVSIKNEVEISEEIAVDEWSFWDEEEMLCHERFSHIWKDHHKFLKEEAFRIINSKPIIKEEVQNSKSELQCSESKTNITEKYLVDPFSSVKTSDLTKCSKSNESNDGQLLSFFKHYFITDIYNEKNCHIHNVSSQSLSSC